MRRLLGSGIVVALALVAGCGPGTKASVIPGASPKHGHDLIVHFGCGACHEVGGVSGAGGHVGPSLTQLPQLQTIAGVLPNTPANVVRFIMDPPHFVPTGDMPKLGLTEAQARDVADYLETSQ